MTEVAVARTPEPSMEERAATGRSEFDGMLEGGFLSGSLITLTGRPGTGKTIFGSHFLHHGAKKAKQAGMYVSMLESEKSYLHNMRRLGLDFEPLIAQKRFSFLELPAPTSEGLPALWRRSLGGSTKTRPSGPGTAPSPRCPLRFRRAAASGPS